MPSLPDFPASKPTDEEIEQWENNFFEIMEDLYHECGLCDEDSLLDDMKKIIGNKEINIEIRDWSVEFVPTDIIEPEAMSRIEASLKGTCLRTNGPTYDWGDLSDSPKWTAIMELIGPVMPPEATLEEIEGGEWPIYDAIGPAVGVLLDAMEREGIRPLIAGNSIPYTPPTNDWLWTSVYLREY